MIFKRIPSSAFLSPYLHLAEVIEERASALETTAAQVAAERVTAFRGLLQEEVDGNVDQLWSKFWQMEGTLRRSYQALN